MCCPTTFGPTSSETFTPLKLNVYRAGVALSTLLWVVAIIGIVALATKTPFGTVGGGCMLGIGAPAAAILSLFLYGDRRTGFNIYVTVNNRTTQTVTRAAESIRDFIQRQTLDGYYLSLNGVRMSEDKCMGDYSCVGATLRAITI